MLRRIRQSNNTEQHPPLGLDPVLSPDAYDYGVRSDGETHGVVLTKPHVVDLILDLAGYLSNRNLTQLRVLEPACGHGAFLLPAVERLLKSSKHFKVPIEDLNNAILAFDIDQDHVKESRQKVSDLLITYGSSHSQAVRLASEWIRKGDFLLGEDPGRFDVVVGNPPYIRIEQLSAELQAEYRSRYFTLYDRADLYVAFIERSLRLLSPKGILSFICADRWTLNKYGAPLRGFINHAFHVNTYIDLHLASPFESEVIAYPSIFVMGREKTAAKTLVARMRTCSEEECRGLGTVSRTGGDAPDGVSMSFYDSWFKGDEPWVMSSPDQLSVLRELESRFPLIEEDPETYIRIGVATGNDKIFIVPKNVDIESDRLVPLVMREDLIDGKVVNSGRFIINAFGPDKGVIDLNDYPRLQKYFEGHESALRKRHVAKKSDRNWFRTIDRVYPEMVKRPKLLIPDIAGSNEAIFESGQFLPHHNLYYIFSNSWDLEVLGGLLSSRVALFFVWSYAVKMRGGYLRFQAQYLRRIRVPLMTAIPDKLRNEIRSAFQKRDFQKLDRLAMRAYGLTKLPQFDFVDTRR
jgi:hypothetical protein